VHVFAEEAQLAAAIGGLEFFEEASPEQTREHAHWKEETRPACDPPVSIRKMVKSRTARKELAWVFGASRRMRMLSMRTFNLLGRMNTTVANTRTKKTRRNG
jgi:hypothetical protein